MNLFAFFCILTLAANVFAQPSVQPVEANEPILQDSLETDSLSKISLALDVDTNGVVDTNKVEHIDVKIEETPDLNVSKKSEPLLLGHFCDFYEIKQYTPWNHTTEVAYAGPSALSLQLLGHRSFSIKHKVLVGLPIITLDVDFDEGKVSDEGLLGLLLFIRIVTFKSEGSAENLWAWINYALFGNTYLPLTENDRFGLFESHHIVDYLIYDLSNSEPWEFGFSEAAGFRFVYASGFEKGVCYLDLGASVRLTNKVFRYGVFVQIGFAGNPFK